MNKSEDPKPWPEPEKIVIMTTPEQLVMEKYVGAIAFGIALRNKIRDAYREGFKAGQNSEIAKGRKD